jgi:hypothetical protein
MRDQADRTPGEEDWLRVHGYLNANRRQLALRAAATLPAEARLAGTSLVAPPAWRLAAPVPLERIRLEFHPDAPPPDVPDLGALLPRALPGRAGGARYQRYSAVVGGLARPAVFENRPVYRLLAADLAGPGGPRLDFGRGRYFDGIDTSGPAGHEYAAAMMSGPVAAAGDLPYRAALGGPSGLRHRVASAAVSALTLRFDRRAGTASFPLHDRRLSQVGHGGGLVSVLPVGVFQPSGEASWNEAADFSLWRGLLREYAEELLGADEEYGSERASIDYDGWPLARAMTDALARGPIRAWCLGLGADPLTFVLDVLAVVVIDAPLYDELFAALVDVNAEGRVIRSCPFDRPSVADLLTEAPLQSAAEALLTLALAHRGLLLS